MTITGIHHVGVVVEDLGAASRLIADDLGLPVVRRLARDDLEARFHACPNASVELIWVRDPTARRARLGPSGSTRIEHLAFEVNDLQTTGAALARVGIELTGPPRRDGGWVSIWTRQESSGGLMLQFTQRVVT